MMDLLIQPSPPVGDYSLLRLDGCRPSIMPRFGRSADSISGIEMKHSHSDDLILNHHSSHENNNNKDLFVPGMAATLPKSSRVVLHDDDLPPTVAAARNHVLPNKTKYYSDSEADNNVCETANRVHYRRATNRQVTLYDRVDPEDSIRDMVSENDFYRFVLFKRHYDKYLHLSQKYEEARNMAYYLEEKYHEIKAERDSLTAKKVDLQKRLESREADLHDKEEELFLQLERVVRLEEECDKLRSEKERLVQLKDTLEKEKKEAYRQLKLQASESEARRRGLERARQEAVHEVTVVSSQKEYLERENERLKELLGEERRDVSHYVTDLSRQKKRMSQNVMGLEKEVSDLKFVNHQSASLNNQLKKGMKHLASCKRKKCSVCAYTRAAFGECRDDRKLLSCFQAPLQDLRNWIRPTKSLEEGRQRSSPVSSTRSEYSFTRDEYSLSPSPSPSLPLSNAAYMSYIDDDSTDSSEGEMDSERGDITGPPCHCSYSVPVDISLASTSSEPRAFSSDSGFSSEINESGRKSRASEKIHSEGEEDTSFSLNRSKWTASFKRLIGRKTKRLVTTKTS